MLKVVSSSRSHSTDQFIPLKNVAVQVNIHSFAAEVCIKQIFINSEELSVPIEAVYCFPVEEQAAIYSFEATLDDGRKIQAQVKEKKTAQREYCHALRQGHGAFLFEQDKKSNDIFTISIGSLQPQSKCEIEIRYVQELDLIDDGQRIQFVLPTTIAPRYSSTSAGDGHIKSPGTTTARYVQSAPYTISFSCSITSLPIASIHSPSHPIQVTSLVSNTQYSTMNACLIQENTHLDRDIILNIDLKQQQTLTYTLVEKQALMVSLVPTLELCDAQNKIGQVNCEYIFVVDCSGSMCDENKIDYARQAMSIFIQSLPIGSYFNIFRFGIKYEQFKSKEITTEYNERSAKEATDYIRRMNADLDGTELYPVLSHLQQAPPKTNYSRQLFVLTDGEIDDVDSVLRLCHSMSKTTRIFSFGLGSAPSRALVKGLARVTNGSYLFIPPNTHVDVAVTRQLDKALEPCLANVKVQCYFDNNELKNYRLSPKIIPPIHAKQRLNVYVMMPQNIEGTLSGSIEFLTDKNDLLERVTFTETQPSSSLIATRLAAKSIITDLQMDDYSSGTSRQVRFTEQQEEDKKRELIEISTRYQILSPYTAFIGVETRTEQEIAAASPGEMILREVPIELSDHQDLPIDDNTSMPQNWSCISDDECDECDDEECANEVDECANECADEVDECVNECANEVDECDDDEGDVCDAANYVCDDEDYVESPGACETILHKAPTYSKPETWQTQNRMKRSRSRSRSPPRRIKSNVDDDNGTDDKSPSDIIREIIALQDFSGLWLINNLKQLIKLLQHETVITALKNVNLEKIMNDYKTKDNDVILSMIIMFIFRKYFTDDEPLWKPLMKKCAKAIENRIGSKEYTEISDKMKEVV